MKKFIFATLAIICFCVTSHTAASETSAPTTKAKSTSPVDRLVATIDNITQRIEGESNQYRIQQIMQSCLDDTEGFTDEEAANYHLTATDKTRLSKSFGKLFGTIATNVGGAAAQSNVQQLTSMIDSNIQRCSTLKELFTNLGLDIVKKTTGRSSF